jgi:sugar lactone lactonase YvrE
MIQLDTSGLQNGASAVVYLSSTTIPGQLVTVIDATGYDSTPQSIVLSPVGSASLAGGGFIQQRFGYITIVSLDSNAWVPVNCNSFPTTAPITYRALDTFSVYTSSLVAYGFISTATSATNSIDAQSLLENTGQSFLSSVNINSYQAYLSTSITDPKLRVWGTTKVYGSTNTIGALNVRGNISTSGNFNVGANISSKLGTIYVGGDITTLGSLRAQRGIQTSVQALSSFNLGSFNLATAINGSVAVGRSLTANNISTTNTSAYNLAVASSISLGSGGQAIQYIAGYLNFLNIPIATPSISSLNIASSNSIRTSSLLFQSFGPASTLRQLNMQNAQIQNANGSLAISSIAGSQIEISQLSAAKIEVLKTTNVTSLNLNDLNYSKSTVIVFPPNDSTILGTVTIPLYWNISSISNNGTLIAPQRTMSTNLIATDIVVADIMNTTKDTFTNFKLNTMIVYSTVYFSSANLLSLNNVHINNIGGSIKGSKTEIASVFQISSIQTDLISSVNTINFYGNSTFSLSSAAISSIVSQTIMTSSLKMTTAILGASMAYSTINPSTPWLLASTFNMNNPPFTFTGGLGTYFNETTFTAATNQVAYYSIINPLLQATFLSTPYINTIAGTGVQGSNRDRGAASNASIGYISGQAAINTQNSIYFGSDFLGWKLRKIESTGTITTVAGNPQYFYGDGLYPTGAALGPKLAVSVVGPGTILITDVSNVRFRYVDQQPIILTIAGNGSIGNSDGIALNATFNQPGMTTADSAGNIFVADSSNNTIRKYAASTMSLYAGSTIAGATGDGGQALAARFAAPYGLAIDSANLLYITDTSNCVIRTISPSGLVQRYAGNYTKGFSGDAAAATAAQLSYPRGITVDPSKNIYFSDTGNKRIRRIDHATGIISTIIGTGQEGYSGDGGPGYLANISSVVGLTSDGDGNIYIADKNNNCIRFWNATTGIITTTAGQPMRGGYQGNNAFATTALFSTPSQVAFDQSSGYYYIADDGNRRIRFVNSATGIIYDYAGNGSPFANGDNIPASNAVFGSIAGVATDLQNNIYIADGAANIIRKIDSITGNISSIARGPFINNPHAILTDLSNNLIFCDTNNHIVRKYFSTTNSFSILAGTGVAGGTGDGRAATAAKLNYPKALTLDTDGNIFIGDSSNYRIRRVDARTGIITTYAGIGSTGTIVAGGSAVSTPIGFITALTTDPTNTVYFTEIPTNGLWQISQGTFQPMNTPSTASYLGDGGPLSGAQFNAPMGVITDTSGNFIVSDSGNYRLRRSYTYGLPQTPVYLNLYLTFTNYYATSGLANVYINGNNIASFNTSSMNSTLSITDVNVYNYPLQGSNPVLGDQTPYIEIRQSGDIGYIKLEGSLYVNEVPGQGFLENSVNNNAGIIMNSGILQFPYAIDGITIQNRYNDTTTRTLVYTGNLNNASDPALKEHIQPATLPICYQTLATLPLRVYNYIPAYQSTFHTRDGTRLGFLTTEVAPHFPNSITPIPFEHAWTASSIQTLDIAQIKYAHLGATQHLIAEVSTLEAAVAELDTLRKILRLRATQRNVVL